MRKFLLALALLVAPAFAQNGLVNMFNISPQAPGTTVTAAILQNGTVGSGLATPSLSPTGTAANFTVGAHNANCTLPENVTISGTTERPMMPSQSLNLLMSSSLTYWTTGVTPGQVYSWTACVTVPGGSPAPSFIDLARTDSDNGKISVFQIVNNGTCARIERDTFATSSCITVAPLQTFWATYKVDNINGINTLKLYQPTYPYTLIGTQTTPQIVGGNIFRWLVGNSQTGTSTGTMSIENQIFDPTGSFPLDSVTFTPLWAGLISPTRAFDWTNPGVLGGIPDAAWTQCGATVAAGSSAATIQAAINACTANHFVQLGAGTFSLTSGITISARTNIAVRGFGADQTFLSFSGTVLNCGGGSNTGFCIRATDGNFNGGPSNTASWTAGFVPGTTTISINAVTNLKVGNYIILDQLDDTQLACDNGGILVSDIKTVCGVGSPVPPGINGPYNGQGNGGGARPQRAQQQTVQVTQCDGNSTTGHACVSGANLTIFPALRMPNWSSTKTPQAWWATSPSQFIGIEDMSIDNTSNVSGVAPCGSTVGIGIYNSPNSWVTGVRSIDSGRAHVQVLFSPRVTVRNNYLYATQNTNVCSYGVEIYSSSDTLIENNIAQMVASPWMFNGPCSGCVIGYNYSVLDLYTGSSLFSANSHGDHDAGNDTGLIEGNEGNIVNADVIHGTGNFMTYYRNNYTGASTCWQSSADTSTTAQIIATGVFGQCTGNTSPFVFNSFHRFYNAIGNILGTTGWNTGYQCAPNSSGVVVCDGSHQVYSIGEGNSGFSPAVPADPNTPVTTMRWNNVDSSHGFSSPQRNCSEVPTILTNQFQQFFSTFCPSFITLPASLYYASTPSWWPSGKAWPPIGPDITFGNESGKGGHAFTIPAHDCATQIGIPADGTGGVRTFNANTCYNQSTLPLASISPSVLAFNSIIVGQSSGTTPTTLFSVGGATLSSIVVSITGPDAGQFSQTNSCPSSLAVGQNCVISIAFNPTSAGAKTASLSVADNAFDTPQTVALSGTGVSAVNSVTIKGAFTISGSTKIQ